MATYDNVCTYACTYVCTYVGMYYFGLLLVMRGITLFEVCMCLQRYTCVEDNDGWDNIVRSMYVSSVLYMCG